MPTSWGLRLKNVAFEGHIAGNHRNLQEGFSAQESRTLANLGLKKARFFLAAEPQGKEGKQGSCALSLKCLRGHRGLKLPKVKLFCATKLHLDPDHVINHGTLLHGVRQLQSLNELSGGPQLSGPISPTYTQGRA